MKTGIGLYGVNGHQITRHLEKHTTAQLIAVAGFEPQHLPDTFRNESNIKRYASLAELLKDPKVELVSLCSPRRRDQADDAIACMRAGKHVYAEKPAALSEADLDRILAAAKETGKHFHEMAGSVFSQPFLGMRKVVQTGMLGTIVQVFAQKSYPYHDRRPIDEDMDGGLVCQAGIHAVRFVEHIAGVRVKNVEAVETGLGNPRGGGLKMAASYLLQLENGGVGTIMANYLNPTGFGQWGNEHVRIFGTNGFIETTDGGTRTRLVVKDKDLGPIDVSAPEKDYFDSFVEFLRDKTPMPLTLEDELHPLRVVIRAKQSAAARK